MPFTPAHPAAVLPLLRHPFSPAALVCGAVAPDMPYFLAGARIPVSAQSWYEPFLNATVSHGLPGIALGLPYALALLALYRLVRRPAADLLSARLLPAESAGSTGSAESAERGGDGLRRAGWVLLSAVIGILSHLVWDSFTHSDGYVVTHLSVLRSHLTGDLTVARALQHISTAGGLVAIAVYLRRRPSRAHAEAPVRAGLPAAARRSVTAALAVAALTGAVLNMETLEDYRGGPAAAGPAPVQQIVEGILSDTATGGGIALAFALTLYACAWWTHRAVRPLSRTT
ncbi:MULTISPECIES: DUF4184 family protein [Streptomyces]|uniref:DUF4184 family protein n=2 Tax=Streptomyces TaxID=1883 RepID=A0A3R7I208_9ACTN|nr:MULTISPECIES: DUF4184 family protein [Streptomyces]KNE84264.1 hypothetical protein ADZ36_00685 [Streptomyces fradiae]OFA58509.1 hypothetical protein BEN35_03445 [Streptomyces fradiae]PQM22115.1 DUF4184 domain-containing protein [Streptomyces xinghaiensis]RKM95365.1 DUF4184 family protein [Streptomyces xinghaiensis]RNC72949.1 DUF4184 family protein [Streptomyces xinghaiensis]